MSKTSRNFSAEQKADVVRGHLKEKVAVGELATELGIQPTQIYPWVASVLGQAEKAFPTRPGYVRQRYTWPTETIQAAE